MTRWWLMLTMVLALLCSGCPSAPTLELHGARLRSATNAGVGLDVIMKVNNDNVFDVKVRNVRVNVVLAEKFRVPTIRYNPDQWLGANSSTLVTVPVFIPWPMVSPLLATSLKSNDVEYSVKGYADVTAVRLLGIESNDYEIDEKGSVSRLNLVIAAGNGLSR